MVLHETLQRQIEDRELAPTVNALRVSALKGLDVLQEEAVRAQLYSPVDEEESPTEPTVVEQALANLIWVRKVMPVVSDVLLKTGSKIEFTQVVFTNSAINCLSKGFGEERHFALTLGAEEIASGEESVVLEDAWSKDARGIRRNIERLASLSPLDVIGKAYSVVDRI